MNPDALYSAPSRYSDANICFNGMTKDEREVLESGAIGAYFYGDNMIANTTQLVAWYKYARLKNWDVKYLDWSQVIVQMQVTPHEWVDRLYHDLNRCVLYIDDFSDSSNQLVSNMVYMFIKRCYNTNTTVFLTSRELVCTERIAQYLGRMTLQFKVETPNEH